MDLIVILALFIYFAVNSKDGSCYHEIATLDEMYGKVAPKEVKKLQESEPEPVQQTAPQDLHKEPPKPPVGIPKPPKPPVGISKPPIGMPTPQMTMPKPPPAPPLGSGVKPGMGMAIPTPKPDNSAKSSTMMGFDFTSFDDVLTSKIDDSAFTELDKNR